MCICIYDFLSCPLSLSLLPLQLFSSSQKYYLKHEQLKAEFKQKTAAAIPPDVAPDPEPMEVSPSVTPPAPKASKLDSKLEGKKEKDQQVEGMKEIQRRPSVEEMEEGEEVQEKVEKEKGRVKHPGMCVAEGCYNMANFEKERGPDYCSNECVVKHCK